MAGLGTPVLFRGDSSKELSPFALQGLVEDPALRETSRILRFKKHLDVAPSKRYNVLKYPGGDIMAANVKRATIYFDPVLHKALKFKAIETSRSISDLVNTAVKEALAEDAVDLAAFDERADEPLISYDEMVKRLKKDGRI
jgi:hypothetical protein